MKIDNCSVNPDWMIARGLRNNNHQNSQIKLRISSENFTLYQTANLSRFNARIGESSPYIKGNGDQPGLKPAF
jgi:hypothetical protein